MIYTIHWQDSKNIPEKMPGGIKIVNSFKQDWTQIETDLSWGDVAELFEPNLVGQNDKIT